MNQKGFVNMVLIGILVVLIGVVGYFVVNRPTFSPEPTPSPIPYPPSTQATSFINNCKGLVNYSAKEYLNGWEKIFKEENKLSESEFNDHITVTEVSLLPTGNTCELSVRYTIKKDWMSVDRQDSMTLGIPPTISPSNLPKEHGVETIGRVGVSTIDLHDQFSFRNAKDALNFFVTKNNLGGTNAKITSEGFSYFWDGKYAINPDGTMKSQEAGNGGKAYITVSGTINANENRCYSGSVFLVSKKTGYSETPCVIN